MPQWLSWVKSNEKLLLGILDDLAKKACETSDALIGLFTNFEKVDDYHNQIKKLLKLFHHLFQLQILDMVLIALFLDPMF